MRPTIVYTMHYNVRNGCKIPNSLHTRLRWNNSALNSNRFHLNLTDSAACTCGAPIENNTHYLVHCPLFSASRQKFLKCIRDLLAPGVAPTTIPALSNDYFVNLVLTGSNELSPHRTNCKIHSDIYY